MFHRLLMKMRGLASRCGMAVLIVETPLKGKKPNPAHDRNLERPNHSLRRAAFNTLRKYAKVQLALQAHQNQRNIVRVRVKPSQFASLGGSALIDVRG